MNPLTEPALIPAWASVLLQVAAVLGAVAAYIRSAANARKLDHNTKVTEEASTKISDKVDANTKITKAIAQSTGTGSFPTLTDDDPKPKE